MRNRDNLTCGGRRGAVCAPALVVTVQPGPKLPLNSAITNCRDERLRARPHGRANITGYAEYPRERLPLVFLLLCCLACCGEFKGIFESSINTSHHATAPRERGKKIANPAKKSAADGVTDDIRDPIVTRQGVYYFVRPGDTLASISRRYKTDWDHIAQINNLYDTELIVGRRLFIPHKKNMNQYLVVTRVITQDRTRTNFKDVTFAWPIENARITSVFGHRRGRPHDGVDIGAKVGTPVLSAEEGRVIFSERFAGYGNLIVIKHPNDFFTAYAHNSKVLVKPGQHVRKGQEISLVGMTGRTTGPHLHFEMRKGIDAIDPLSVLPKI